MYSDVSLWFLNSCSTRNINVYEDCPFLLGGEGRGGRVARAAFGAEF